MEFVRLQLLLFISCSAVLCSENFTQRVGAFYWIVQSQKDLEICKGDLISAASQSPLGTVGVHLMTSHEQGGSGFVYSELKSIHKLMQLFAVASTGARKKIEKFLGLQLISKCQEIYFKAVRSFIHEIAKRQKHYIYYESILFHQENKRLAPLSEFFAEVRELDFEARQEYVLSELNREYQRFSGNVQGQCLEKPLDSGTDFYFLNGLKVNPFVFGPTSSFKNPKMSFTDLDGENHQIEWLQFTGPIWVGTILMSAGTSSQNWYTLTLVHTETADGSLSMFYFQPDFKPGVTREQKTECLQKIFSDLGQIRHYAVNKVGDTQRTVKYLGLPPIHIKTDVDLKSSLMTDLDTLFQYDQITKLYDTPDTLQELRNCDYFYNKASDRNFPGRIPPDDDKVVIYLNSPFVFAVTDNTTNVVIEAGALLRPNTVTK